MKKWRLTCSVDAIDIDYETILFNRKEPDFLTCENIAQSNGCSFWTIEEVM